jgi:hypothetical protein
VDAAGANLDAAIDANARIQATLLSHLPWVFQSAPLKRTL